MEQINENNYPLSIVNYQLIRTFATETAISELSVSELQKQTNVWSFMIEKTK